jgi:hypothetical protein
MAGQHHSPDDQQRTQRAGLFTHGEVPDLNMPDGSKRSIMTWFAHLTADRGQTRH